MKERNVFIGVALSHQNWYSAILLANDDKGLRQSTQPEFRQTSARGLMVLHRGQKCRRTGWMLTVSAQKNVEAERERVDLEILVFA